MSTKTLKIKCPYCKRLFVRRTATQSVWCPYCRGAIDGLEQHSVVVVENNLREAQPVANREVRPI